LENVEMTFWKGRNVFVTGATGLLGAWLVEELLARGANVTCLIRDWVPGSRLLDAEADADPVVKRTQVVNGDLADLPVIVRALNEYEIDTVFHLGAQTIVGTAARSPISTFESNIRGSWNVLEACRSLPSRIERVVVASSDKAYGFHDGRAYTEDMPLIGRFPYDVSKSCADLIAFSYYHTYGTPVAVTRCGNLFGGGDLNFNRLVPGTIQSALAGERPIIRSDGKFVREYFYARDAVDAYLQLAERVPGADFSGEAFNFGTESPLSVIELVEKILVLMGRTELEPVILNEAAHEIPEQQLDCGKARRLLAWKPAHSLDDALTETIEWYRARHSRTRGQ
jgi:CDP-glucose 4,6-dehydratase